MGMFDNARSDHERGLHIGGDTSGVCPYCEGEICEECLAERLDEGGEHEEGCSKPVSDGSMGREECPACGVPVELSQLYMKLVVDAIKADRTWKEAMERVSKA